MTINKKKFSITGILITLLSLSGILNAGSQTTFELSPVSTTSFAITAGELAIAQYTVTNNTQVERSFVLAPQTGISQREGTNLCTNPFTLNTNESCTLSILLNASEIASNTTIRPTVCKAGDNNQADDFLCSKTSETDALQIVINPGVINAYVYFTADNEDAVYQCRPILETGTVDDCQTLSLSALDRPEGIVFNPAKTFVYIANSGNETITQCIVDQIDGSFTTCQDAGANDLADPRGIAINPAGTIAYIANYAAGSTIDKCDINPTTGLFDSTCTNSGANGLGRPADIVINPSNTFAYVANWNTYSIKRCDIDSGNSGALSNCLDVFSQENTQFNGLAINRSGTKLYASDFNLGRVTSCDIANDGSLSCNVVSGQDTQRTQGVALSSAERFLYIAKNDNTNYAYCDLDASDNVESCLNDSLSLLDNTRGVATLVL